MQFIKCITHFIFSPCEIGTLSSHTRRATRRKQYVMKNKDNYSTIINYHIRKEKHLYRGLMNVNTQRLQAADEKCVLKR